MKVRPKDEHGYPLDFSDFRFIKRLSLPGIPKPEEPLALSVASGRTFETKVARSDWSEDQGLFVVACQYGSRSISPEEYADLAADPEWELKPLI